VVPRTAQLERDGHAEHKTLQMHSVAEIEAFFRDYVLDLVASMRRDGYLVTRTAQHGRVLVGADGDLHKSLQGRHRFFVARHLGVPTMPLRVTGIHRSWAEQQGLTRGVGAIPRLRHALRELARRHG
jgi:hypothetical protein